MGIRIGQMLPGRWNAITDVPGVRVGHSTVIRGSGKLVVGEGPVRTGVTAIWAQSDILERYLPCGYDMPNANGEVTGLLLGSVSHKVMNLAPCDLPPENRSI